MAREFEAKKHLHEHPDDLTAIESQRDGSLKPWTSVHGTRPATHRVTT